MKDEMQHKIGESGVEWGRNVREFEGCRQDREGGALVVREGPMLLGIQAPKIRSSGRQRSPPRIVDVSSSTESPPSGKLHPCWTVFRILSRSLI